MRIFVLGLLTLLLGWAPEIEAYNVYYGNLHSHSALSDGIGTPEEAFAYARDVAEIDVLALTDHTHLLTPTEWDLLLSTADAMTEDGIFVALGAQEFGNLNDFGHMNIFDSAYRNPNPTENLAASYQFLQTVGAFATFNHPNPAYGTNFDDLAFVPEYIDQMVGIEMRNGIRADDYEAQYIQALQNGWHLAPLANQDNHEGHWGDQGNPNMGGQIYLTGFLADSLTKEEILTAFRERRFYAMEVDPISDRIELEFYANGVIMGGSVVSGALLTLTGTAVAINGASLFSRVDLFEDGEIVDGVTEIGSSIDWTFQRALQDGESHFYFVRIRQVDGDLTWSSPIWVTAEIDPAAVEEVTESQRFRLLPNVPNPFRPATSLVYQLPAQPGGGPYRVAIRLYDLHGREVGRMDEVERSPGSYRWSWSATGRNGRNLPSGVYLCRLLVDGAVVDSRRIVLAR